MNQRLITPLAVLAAAYAQWGQRQLQSGRYFPIVLLTNGHDCPLLYIDSDFAITDP
jgi:hypothetical protein